MAESAIATVDRMENLSMFWLFEMVLYELLAQVATGRGSTDRKRQRDENERRGFGTTTTTAV